MRRLCRLLGGGLVFFFLIPVAHARVFSFKSSWVAAHIRGTGQLTQQNNEAYNGTSGNDTHFGDGAKYNFSGEVGFSFLTSETTTWRVGLEGLESKPVSTTGTSYTTGNPIMNVSSLVTVFNPNFAFEYAFSVTPVSRTYGFLGAGYALAKVNNSYSNVTAYSAASSFSETWGASAVSGIAGAGFEYYAFDNVTFSFEGGYRYMKFGSLTQSGSDTVIRGSSTQSVSSGATVVDGYGNNVHIDMSGPFVGFMIRFFIPPLN
jgi:hypothetical protein